MAATAHSTGDSVTFTVTFALCGLRRRTVESGTPTVTDSVIAAVAFATDTASVMASVRAPTAVAGPTTSTVAGSALTVPTTNPSAGSPSTFGTTGTILVADSSNAIATLEGAIWTTSMPNGTRTSEPAR